MCQFGQIKVRHTHTGDIDIRPLRQEGSCFAAQRSIDRRVMRYEGQYLARAVSLALGQQYFTENDGAAGLEFWTVDGDCDLHQCREVLTRSAKFTAAKRQTRELHFQPGFTGTISGSFCNLQSADSVLVR
jgi:hypothetical protein